MKTIIEFFLVCLFRLAFWFRYRVKVVGLEHLNSKRLNKTGGVLFLPNHPTNFVDPTLVTIHVWKKYGIRPMIVEYMYYTPVVHWFMRIVDALPVPNFSTSSNSLKKKKVENVKKAVIEGLKHKENFLIYPAGKVKGSSQEIIGGSSAVHEIIQAAPDANIVLVRTKGLWGSSFSKAFTNTTPPLFPTLIAGVKEVFKNFIFFTPRRNVVIEFEPAPADFPYKASRIELNKYLENWYNKPDGLTVQKGEAPGDSLILVSHSLWGEKYPEMRKQTSSSEEGDIKFSEIPNVVKDKVLGKLSEMTEMHASLIKPDMELAGELGLDSLDQAELIAFLHDQFDITNVPLKELTTVSRLMAIASQQIVFKEEVEDDQIDTRKWKELKTRPEVFLGKGQTIPEVFLNTSNRMKEFVACADFRSGVLTYAEMRMRMILLAEYIRDLPGKYIGVLLPATVAANLLILSIQLAGKVPLMINWTIGPRHLESVVKLSDVKAVLTSWSFIDKLENVNLDAIEDRLIMLEDARRQISLFDKLKAFYRSKLSTKKILKIFRLNQQNPNQQAVLLFTSGTESMPKGVPLSHRNILSDMQAYFDSVPFYSDDVMFGILPPFHAFGFTVSGLSGLLSGLRVAYYPDPTDGLRLASAFEKWGGTIMCGAPTFIKGMLKAATAEQMRTLRVCASGAEKAPPELLKLLAKIGKEKTFIEGYGITECSPVLTFNDSGNTEKGVGKPLPGVELLIVHPDTMELIPQGATGLILAKGPNIFAGYLNPGLSSPFVTVEGKEWYKTGDLGHLDKEGNLIISGRFKRFIKIGAEMISLASIEDALLQVAVKKGWPTEDGPTIAVCAQEQPGDKPKILLFTRFDTNLDEVNSSLKESGFSNLVKISSVTNLAEIPIMGTGKINYRLLESQYL